RSGEPAITYYNACVLCGRGGEGLLALRAAAARHADDSELALALAQAESAHGEHERAQELLTAARTRSRHASWLRTAASVSERKGGPAAALPLWRELIGAQPYDFEAHAQYAAALAAVEGRAAALAHLERVYA